MKAQKVIRIIMSALLTVTLCFCMIGCQSSEEEIRRRELEQAKRTRIEEIEKQKESCRALHFRSYCGDKTRYTAADYHTFCAFYALCEKACEEEKAEIEKIENIEDMPDYMVFRQKMRSIYTHRIRLGWMGFDNISISPRIKTETEDDIMYEIKSTYNMLSSGNYPYLIMDSADKELEVEYKVKLYFENGEEKEYNKKEDKIRTLYETDYDRLYKSGNGACIETEIGITVRKNDEIIGYTLLGGGVEIDCLKVKKSAAIKSESRSIVTSEKVEEYLKSEDAEAEKRDGIKLTASEVKYYIGYYFPHPSVGYAEITLRQVSDETGKVYNEVVFDNDKKNDLRRYECWADNGTIEANGEQAARIELGEDKEDVIRWAANSGGSEYLNIVGKYDGVNDAILLLKTKKLDEEVYEGNLLMPEVYACYVLGGKFDIDNEKDLESMFGDSSFAIYIEALKKNEYRRPL